MDVSTPTANFASTEYKKKNSYNNQQNFQRGQEGYSARGGKTEVVEMVAMVVMVIITDLCEVCGKDDHIAIKCYHMFDLSYQGLDFANGVVHMVHMVVVYIAEIHRIIKPILQL